MNAVRVLERGRCGGVVRVALLVQHPTSTERKERPSLVKNEEAIDTDGLEQPPPTVTPLRGRGGARVHPEQSLLSSHPSSPRGLEKFCGNVRTSGSVSRPCQLLRRFPHRCCGGLHYGFMYCNIRQLFFFTTFFRS